MQICFSIRPFALQPFHFHSSGFLPCFFDDSVRGLFTHELPTSLFTSYIGKISKGRCLCCTFLFLFCLYALWLLSPLMVSSFLGQYQEVLSHGQVCFSVTVGVLADMGRVECRARSIFISSPDKVQISSQADLPSSEAASVLQHHSTCCLHRPKGCGEPSQIRPGPNLVLCNAHELRQT